MSVKGAGQSYCYLVATAYNASLHSAPIIDSGASTTFFTSDDYLTNAGKHKTPIKTANGRTSFTKSSRNLKLTRTRSPIFLPVLSAPDFNQNLISVGQLAMKHNVLFMKTGCYLLEWNPPPLHQTPTSSDSADQTTYIEWKKIKQMKIKHSQPPQQPHQWSKISAFTTL